MPLDLLPGHRVNVGDTAELRHYIFLDDANAATATDIASVQYTIQKPDKSQYTQAGVVESDGAGFFRVTDTSEVGEYKYIAKFTLTTGEIRSIRDSFEVVDPFDPPIPEPIEVLMSRVWMKFEDLFDAEEGGPWLRDETYARFDKTKIPEFISEAILDINVAPPTTEVGIDHFITPGPDGGLDPDSPLLELGIFLAMVRHLMRSYVEQPLATGASVFYEDRRDYLQRWQIIYQMENERFMRLIALWKRQFIGLGKSKLLVTAKAGRLLPAPLRTRNIGRGYY